MPCDAARCISLAASDSAGSAMTAEKVSKIDCAGVNECKGKGTCKQATHGCGGQNDCKGKGFVETKTPKECADNGGKVLAESVWPARWTWTTCSAGIASR